MKLGKKACEILDSALAEYLENSSYDVGHHLTVEELKSIYDAIMEIVKAHPECRFEHLLYSIEAFKETVKK